MRPVVVGVGDCAACSDADSFLITYALGSCIAVAIYDPLPRVGGLLHYMLPDSSLDAAKARERPFMFADTGIPILFERAYGLGACKSRLQVSVIGGAQLISGADRFNIGKRNHLALRKIFWKAGILVRHEDVGGTTSRTVRLELQDGRVMLRKGQSETLLNAMAVGQDGGISGFDCR